MAQKMIDLKRKKLDACTQTGYDYEFTHCLSTNKRINLYHSKCYNDYILSFNYGSCKKFVINKSMWNKFREKFNQIDFVLGYKNDSTNE